MKLMYSQMVMKLVRIIMVKLLWTICTLLPSNGLERLSEYLALLLTLCQNIYMHEISTNFETGLTIYNV